LDQLGTEILCREPKPLRQIDSQVPAELERICLKCLRKDVAERYATAGDFAEDLRRFLTHSRQHETGDGAGREIDGPTGAPRPRRGRRAAGLLAVGIVAALACVGGGTWYGLVAGNSRLARDALVDLRVWDPTDGRRRGVGIREDGVLPLRAGDQVRLEVDLNLPAYAYVVWIDSEGAVSPVYPWQRGDWSQRPTSEAPVERLSLPAAADQAWTVKESPAGMETIVLLARTEPWHEAEEFFGSLGQLGKQAGNRPSVLEWRNGGIWLREHSPTRAADFAGTSTLIDAVILNQQAIAARLGDGFVLHHAMSFPIDALPRGGTDHASQ
jgi:hypothetical protein